jgi:GPH family glycoside/pentoside/hexuronide:cation symporter
MAIQEDLSEWEIASTGKMISYGFGYVIVNFLLSYGLSVLFYYYEVELGLPVLLVGMAFIIFAIWNMINDPLLGYLTERKRKWLDPSKYGFRAPWVVLTSIPVLIFYFLIWTPVFGTGATVLFLWFIIMTCLFDTFFSIYNDHVYGGFTNQFPSEYERRRAFAFSTLILGIFIILLSVITNFIIVYGDPASFVRAALVIIIFLIVFNIILFAGIRESKEMKAMFVRGFAEEKKASFGKVLKTTLTTKNFVVSLIGYTISITALALWNASLIYVYKDIYIIPFTAGALPSLVGVVFFLGLIPFWYNYSRKHGFKKTYWVCFILHGLAFIPFLFMPARYTPLHPYSILIHTALFIFWEIAYSGEVLMLMPVAADTYDEVSAKMGKRVDATLVGIRNFFFRLAFLVQAVIFTVIHIWTAYNPDPFASQSGLAIWGIKVHWLVIPAIMYLATGLFFRKFYTLEGAEKQALVKKLKDLQIYR